ESELEDEISARTEPRRRLRDEAPDETKAVGGAEQRDRGFMIANLRLKPTAIGFAHVRRIRSDEVEVERTIDAFEQVRAHDVHAFGDTQPSDVSSRDLERFL